MALKLIDVAYINVKSLAETRREGHERCFRDLRSLISEDESDILEAAFENSTLLGGICKCGCG